MTAWPRSLFRSAKVIAIFTGLVHALRASALKTRASKAVKRRTDIDFEFCLRFENAQTSRTAFGACGMRLDSRGGIYDSECVSVVRLDDDLLECKPSLGDSCVT